MPKRKLRKLSGGNLIFRRFIRTKDGRILDAYKYGHKTWPLLINKQKRD